MTREPLSGAKEPDVLAGLPDDLARLLRDPSIIVPQDQAVFELVAKWMDAPSDTASAMSVDEWRQAWSVTCRRMLEAQAERDRYREALERVYQTGRGPHVAIAREALDRG